MSGARDRCWRRFSAADRRRVPMPRASFSCERNLMLISVENSTELAIGQDGWLATVLSQQ
jgi:hypothetical protein